MSGALATIVWDAPPARLDAATDRVDVWWLPTGDAPGTRAALRGVLGRYLGVPGAELVFRSSAAGKPSLDPRHGGDLRFSLSHSAGVALAAVRLGHEVGVDVERIRPDVDCDAVANSIFPSSLRIAWRSGLAAGRRDAFFDAWVRFEALAKAGGEGIAGTDPLRGSERFSCRALPAPEGFAAAAASEGAGWTLACWRDVQRRGMRATR